VIKDAEEEWRRGEARVPAGIWRLIERLSQKSEELDNALEEDRLLGLSEVGVGLMDFYEGVRRDFHTSAERLERAKKT
jgi:hypothetical protein